MSTAADAKTAQQAQQGAQQRRPASPNLLDNLLDSNDAAANLADLSLTGLVEPEHGIKASSSARQARPSLKGGARRARPSWGPTPGPVTGSIRMLQGLGEEAGQDATPGQDTHKLPSSSGSGDKRAQTNTAGGVGSSGGGGAKGRPRFSLFGRNSLAPAQLHRALASTIDEQAVLPRLSEGGVVAAASEDAADFAKGAGTGSSSSATAVPTGTLIDVEPSSSGTATPKPTLPVAPDAAKQPATVTVPTSSGTDADTARSNAAREREEMLKRNLLEARRLNEVFEAFESMLMNSAEQIDQFAARVRTTDQLLDSYIGLLRESSRTQELLLSEEWKGASADSAEAHALAVALAQRETERVRAEEEQRRLALEIERRRREAAEREAAQAREEDARRAALVGASAATGVGRGMRASTVGRGASTARRGGPAAGAGARVGSTTGSTTGRGAAAARPPVAGHNRGASASARGGAGATSSSGSRIARPSTIPRAPSASRG